MATVDDIATIQALGLKQPRDFITLTPYQQLAHHFGVQKKRFILSLDKGLGKTLVDYLVLEDLQVPRVIVLCTTNAYTTWEVQAEQWKTKFGGKVQVIEGSPFVRSQQWRNSDAQVFVTTPVGFLNDCGQRYVKGVASEILVPRWVLADPNYALIVDEFQKFLRNHGGQKKPNKIWKLLKTLPFSVFIPTSGSAVSKGPQDIWPVLNLINPRKYSSYWQYVYRWCEIDDGIFGKTILGPKDYPQWRAFVAPEIFHRTKAMVQDQLPPKLRHIMDVRMEPWQKKLHDDLRDQLWTETPDGDFIFAKNKLASIYKLRLALICPRVLHPSYGVGIGIQSIVDSCEESEIGRFVVNTPFKAPIPHLKKYLEERGYKVWVLRGGIKKVEREQAIAEWSVCERGAILQTIKYAQSYELIASPYGFFLGYEWDPEENKQAEDRQNRLSSTETTVIYYVRHFGAYDHTILSLNVEKSLNVNRMWGTLGLETFGDSVSEMNLTQFVGLSGQELDFTGIEGYEPEVEDTEEDIA